MSERLSLMKRLSTALTFGTNGRRGPLTDMVHASGGFGAITWLFEDILGARRLPATKEDYAKEVGNGLGSSVLAAPINFILRTFPEAPPIVERLTGNEWAEERKHRLTKLLHRPNAFYGGRTFWMGTVLDFTFGNAYWLKIRNGAGEVVQLWWVPRQMIKPRWPTDGSAFISHYDYLTPAGTFEVQPKDIVHFRFGIDPENTRLGLSPLGALAREIHVDDQAANFTAAILKNLGIVGVVISPKAGSAQQGSFEETKEYLDKHFTGDKRGKALALSRPTDVQLLQYNLQGFDVAPIRDVSEERVCAALGIPAAVVGFGTGLHQTKVGATMKEMRQLAWTGGIIPLQEMIADEIDRSLIPDIEGTMEDTDQDLDVRMRFDTSKVRALWEDTSEKHDRIRKDYQAKLIDRATALREMGRTAKPEDEGVYYSGPAPQDSPKPNPGTAPPTSGGEDET